MYHNNTPNCLFCENFITFGFKRCNMTEKQFEKYFRGLYVPLGMYALRFSNSVEEAEDVVQEAFVKVWNVVNSGRCIDNFKSFINKVVSNLCQNRIRNKNEILDFGSLSDIPDEDMDTSERDAKVWKAIERLPPKCREIFLMSKRDGYSNAEIAEELGISIKTVKNQMTKALSRLRDELSVVYKPFFLPFL